MNIDSYYESHLQDPHWTPRPLHPLKNLQRTKETKAIYEVTHEELQAIRKKHRCWIRYLETKSDVKYKEYGRARNKVISKIIRKAQYPLENRVCNNIKENPKTILEIRSLENPTWKIQATKLPAQTKIKVNPCQISLPLSSLKNYNLTLQCHNLTFLHQVQLCQPLT